MTVIRQLTVRLQPFRIDSETPARFCGVPMLQFKELIIRDDDLQ